MEQEVLNHPLTITTLFLVKLLMKLLNLQKNLWLYNKKINF